MTYNFHAKAMWYLFAPSFKKSLAKHWNKTEAKPVICKAKPLYKKLIRQTPTIGGVKENQHEMSLMNACLVASIYFASGKLIDLETFTMVYHDGMKNSLPMKKLRCDLFSSEEQAKRFSHAEKNQNSNYKYNWVWTFTPDDGSGRCMANYTKCGIWELFKNLGISEITPAMCQFDYAMADMMGVDFFRKSTLACGADKCDFLYLKKE